MGSHQCEVIQEYLTHCRLRNVHGRRVRRQLGGFLGQNFGTQLLGHEDSVVACPCCYLRRTIVIIFLAPLGALSDTALLRTSHESTSVNKDHRHAGLCELLSAPPQIHLGTRLGVHGPAVRSTMLWRFELIVWYGSGVLVVPVVPGLPYLLGRCIAVSYPEDNSS